MEYTRPATWEDVKRLALDLDAQKAEHELVGGYAIAAHGFNRFSEDIDILVNPSAENARRQTTTQTDCLRGRCCDLWALALGKISGTRT